MSTVLANMRKSVERIVRAFLDGRSAREGRRPDYQSGPRYETDGVWIKQWGNLVAIKDGDHVRINDAGYKTVTTKQLLNTILDVMGSPWRIDQHKYQWMLRNWQTGEKKPWTGMADIYYGGRTVEANGRRRTRRNPGTKLTWEMPLKQAQRVAAKLRKRGIPVRLKPVPRATEPPGSDYQSYGFYVQKRDEERANAELDRMFFQGPPDSPRLISKSRAKQRRWLIYGKRAMYRPGEYKYEVEARRRQERAQRRNPGKFWYVWDTVMDRAKAGPFASDTAARAALRKIPEHDIKLAISPRQYRYRVAYDRGGPAGPQFVRNPLTRKEAGKALKSARRQLEAARTSSGEGSRAYHAGMAGGLTTAVHLFGPRNDRRAMTKVAARESALFNGITSVLGNLHSKAEQDRAVKLCNRYFAAARDAKYRGPKAAHAYGALAAIRRLGRLERPIPWRVVNHANHLMGLVRTYAKGGGR